MTDTELKALPLTPKVEEWLRKLGRWIDDDCLAERLARRMSDADLHLLTVEFEKERRDAINGFCERTNKLPTQRAKAAAIAEGCGDTP